VATIYIDKCVVAVDGVPGKVPGLGKQLGVKDRGIIVKQLMEAPGPILGEVVLPCSNCGAELPYALSMSDIFRE
jgi:hypothetical protein